MLTLTLLGSASYALFNAAATMIKTLGNSADDKTTLVIQVSVLSRWAMPLLIFHNEYNTGGNVRGVNFCGCWARDSWRSRMEVILKQRTCHSQYTTLSVVTTDTPLLIDPNNHTSNNTMTYVQAYF